MDDKTGYILPEEAKTAGKDLTDAYASGDPFPWIVIDDFLPEHVAESMLDNFGAKTADPESLSFDRAQERFKTSFHPDATPDYARGIFYAFNSRPFIKVLENITGIKGLIPDPYFLGAGFHEISNGGHLSVHADFNHHLPLNLERRINVLIYLNKDWDEEYGGQLELWDTAMTKKKHSILPIFNRCVIFNTTSDSMHGNPRVVNHPKCISRKSIALYYYTATWDATRKAHTTQFKARPNSNDKRDWQVAMSELTSDIIPPIVLRNYARAGRLIRRMVAR